MSIQLYDVHSDSFQEYQEHDKESVLDWHPTNQYYFTSGSSDRKILIFDTRVSSKSLMKLNDHHNSGISYNDSLGVECVKFCPHDGNYIASSQKRGNITIWDIRTAAQTQ